MAEPRPPAAGAVARRPNRAVMLFLSALVLWFLLQLLLGTGYGPDPGELLAAVPLLGRGLALTAYISFVSLISGQASSPSCFCSASSCHGRRSIGLSLPGAQSFAERR